MDPEKLGPQWYSHSQPEEINAAIDSYMQRIPKVAGGETQAPYDPASMAEIYSPRVQQLMDLQAQGFTHARWGGNPETGHNQWFGHTPESGEK